MNKITTIISSIGICAVTLSCVSQSVFINPVIHSDVPDPSVIRVADSYYLAGTSGNATPVYPIYRSSDLVNWVQTGAVFDCPPEWTKGEFWAPELYSHRGKYYCYYTAKAAVDGISCIGVAVADKPEGPYVDHGPLVRWTNEAIDAFVYSDNGQLYITWKAYGLEPNRPIEIIGCRLSDDGLSLDGEPFTMLTDMEDIGMEGQCLFQKGRYYYLLYSARDCCSERSDYEVCVARAENITGPYEKYAGNPILKGDERYVQSCGHGTMTETPDGRMFYICHSFMRGRDFYLGRQPMMQELVVDDGWVKFKTGSTARVKQKTPFGTPAVVPNKYVDTFDDGLLDAGWTGNIASRLERPTPSNGRLLLPPAPKGAPDYSATLCRRPSAADYVFEVHMDCSTDNFSGLTYMSGVSNQIMLGTQGGRIVVRTLKDGIASDLHATDYSAADVRLRIEVDDVATLRFFYSADGVEWRPIGDASVDVFDSVRRAHYKPGLVCAGSAEKPATVYSFSMVNR